MTTTASTPTAVTETRRAAGEALPWTAPGLSTEATTRLVESLQDRLGSLTDLHLTLKHVHWNVVGPTFVAVHEMLDPQVDAVRLMADDVAERIATLGGVPVGTPGALVERRGWSDYAVGRADASEHLVALDRVYEGVIGDHRAATALAGELDPVTEDLLVSQTRELEKLHWFVRAHYGV